MYKVGHSGSRSTQMVYSNRRNVVRPEAQDRNHNRKQWFLDDKLLERYATDEEVPNKTKIITCESQVPKKQLNGKIPQKITPEHREMVTAMSNAWKAFSTDAEGNPDKTIVHYRPKTPLPKDFKPFNFEEYMAEKMLREINLDPKIVNGMSKKGVRSAKNSN